MNRSEPALSTMVPADRFEVGDDPPTWRCRSCDATPFSAASAAGADRATAVARLAEAAADHALECGRCND